MIDAGVYEHHMTHGPDSCGAAVAARNQEGIAALQRLAQGGRDHRDSLRRWFQHDAAKWAEFQRRYRMNWMSIRMRGAIVAAARTGTSFCCTAHTTRAQQRRGAAWTMSTQKLDQPAK